jgi:hypothetical protein
VTLAWRSLASWLLGGGAVPTTGGAFADMVATITGRGTLAASVSSNVPDVDEVGMSLAKVRTRIAQIVEATPTLSTARGLPQRFRHFAECADTDPPQDSRGFYLVADTVATRGPYTPRSQSNRRLDVVRLVVCYRSDIEDAQLGDTISADYDAISRRLLDTSLWQSDTSTLLSLALAETQILPAAIESPTDGLTTMTITLDVEHQR